MASLTSRHVASCPLPEWVPINPSQPKRPPGCKCPHGPLYKVAVRKGKRTNWEPVGRNLKAAVRVFNRVQADESEHGYSAVRRVRFSEWAKKWLAALDVEPGTLGTYVAAMKIAIEFFGDQYVDQITVADVNDFHQWMKTLVLDRKHGLRSDFPWRQALPEERPLSPSTRHKHLSTLRTSFQSAVAYHHARENPVSSLPEANWPKKERHEAGYYTNEELKRLFTVFPAGVVRAVCLLALLTGLRLGELLGLMWVNVDLEDQQLWVRWQRNGRRLTTPKSHEIRAVDLSAEAVALLRSLKATADPLSSDVFIDPATGRVLRRKKVWDGLYNALREAGIDRIGPTDEERAMHTFRHSFAKKAIEAGATLEWLKEQLGHYSISLTYDTYGHWERSEQKRHARRMDGVFAELLSEELRAAGPSPTLNFPTFSPTLSRSCSTVTGAQPPSRSGCFHRARCSRNGPRLR